MRWAIAALLLFRLPLAAGAGADLERHIREDGFDREECYRVRDLSIIKDELKIFLADGHLIFSKPLAGRRIAAVFAADTEGGDGEVMLFPPTRAERQALASHIQLPNLDEHFQSAIFLFTGPEYDALLSQFPKTPANRKDPAPSAALDEAWAPTLRSMGSSFETRLALDLLGGAAARPGLFAAVFHSAKLRNFEVVYDPSSPEQIIAGQVATRGEQVYFDTWTAFEARSFRGKPGASREDVLVSDYRIEATISPTLSLEAVTRVRVKPVVDGVSAVSFEIAPQMNVSSVTVDGKPAEVLQRESLRVDLMRGANDPFLVFPPEPLRAGREYEFEMHHAGGVIEDAGDRVFFVTARGNWYPLHGAQFAHYDLLFRYPRDLDLVAAGDVVEDHAEGDWRTTRRRTAGSIRFAAFNLGNYAHVRLERAGFVVDVCANRSLERALNPHSPGVILPPVTFPGRGTVQLPPVPAPVRSPLEGLQALAADIAGALEFMSAKFGPPALPHIAVSPIPGTFGQGFPGLIYLSTLAYLREPAAQPNANNAARELYLDDLLEAHEVAHQWWGNRVSASFGRDAWIMEALANSTALLYIESKKGARLADLLLDNYRVSLLQKDSAGQTVESAGPIVFGPRLESSEHPLAYHTVTYGKGTWIMQMLRRRMGDQRYLALLGEMLKRYDRREITTEEFRDLAAQFLPPHSDDPKLESFFEQWVYGTGIPTLKLNWSLKGKAPALRVVGTVTQSDVDEEFTALVPVEIQTGRGPARVQWVRTSNEPAPFTVSVAQAPTRVALDPHNAVLRR